MTQPSLLDSNGDRAAELRVVRAIKRLSPESRDRVLQAAKHIVDAEALIPGIFSKMSETPAKTE